MVFKTTLVYHTSYLSLYGNLFNCFSKVYPETTLIETLSSECETFAKKTEELKRAVENAVNYRSDSLTLAKYYRNTVFALMNELRETGDSMEKKTSAKYWPYPSYGEILFGV